MSSKYEYYLHYWGQVENEGWIEKDLGIQGRDFWFNTEGDREQFKQKLQNVADKHGVMIALAGEKGNHVRKKPVAKIKLQYKDRVYEVEDTSYWYGYPEDSVRFSWEENNYSCDCNRSSVIQHQCDPNFPEMDCGDKIILLDLQIEHRQ